MATTDGIQFGFTPGRGTIYFAFNLRQLQAKYLSKNRHLYLAFIDLEKAFNIVSHAVPWWAMRKLGVDEWLVKIIQLMNQNIFSKVRVGVRVTLVRVHQGIVPSPLLFIIILQAQAVHDSCSTQMTWSSPPTATIIQQPEYHNGSAIWRPKASG